MLIIFNVDELRNSSLCSRPWPKGLFCINCTYVYNNDIRNIEIILSDMHHNMTMRLPQDIFFYLKQKCLNEYLTFLP